MKRVVLSISICAILLFCLTGCGKQETNDINGKLDAELQYVEDLLFKIANKYVKEEYIEEDVINWNGIKEDVQKLNSSWSSLILDLASINVSNDDILDYSNDLNNLLISIHNEDEQVMLNRVDNLYKKVIIFRETYSENKNLIKKDKIKSGVLETFDLVHQDNWEAAKLKINSIIENYKNLMNDISYAEEYGYQLNKIYVLLEEYKASIGSQNYDLVRMKYIITVEEL